MYATPATAFSIPQVVRHKETGELLITREPPAAPDVAALDPGYAHDRAANYGEWINHKRRELLARRAKERAMTLSFNDLRAANLKRLPLFKDKHGRIAHAIADGSGWSDAEWLQAVVGELGELANVMKKVRRGDLTMEEARAEVSKELADVQIYLDILAFRLGVDLGEATVAKFDEVSRRVGANVFLATPEGVDR